jgi:hypothetical protein
VSVKAVVPAWLLCWVVALPALAQTVSHRGFADLTGTFFPQEAPNDAVQAVGDLLAREEVFVRVGSTAQVAGGLEARGNTHEQVERSWRLDYTDRGVLRPALSIRRLSLTVTSARATVDLGKQFIRWGKTDIVTPTDRFAPRDYMNILDSPFLAVTGARVDVRLGGDTIDVVWVPLFTPSRTPLLDQRWTVLPPGVGPLEIVDAGSRFPSRPQVGIRWSHTGSGLDYAAAFFDGLNNLPTLDIRAPSTPTASPGFVREVDVTRVYPQMRMYGGDAAVAVPWFTIKGEAAYFTSSSFSADEYVLYVIQLERQSGEWSFVGGYAGQHVTRQRTFEFQTFAPDRGLTETIVGRASYTFDVNRSLSIEGAVRQNGDGAYARAEFSRAYGEHWRAIAAGALIRGEPTDFLGQFRHNSNATVTFRYSF